MSILSQDSTLNPEAAAFAHPFSKTDSPKCNLHRLYFHTCGHTLTVVTHDQRVCKYTDTSKACPGIYASPETSHSSTFSLEACHICTNNMSWISEHASTLISASDLDTAPDMNVIDEVRSKELSRANWDEQATLPSVLALEQGCVVRQMRFGGCTCVMEVLTHSTNCHKRGLSQCDENELLVAIDSAGDLWQEGGCAWCRGDTGYLLRYGGVIRRLEGSGFTAGLSGMGGDFRGVENWIGGVPVPCFPFAGQDGGMGYLGAMGLYGYGGGQGGYAESVYLCDPSEAYWTGEEYIYPSQECSFAEQYTPSEPTPQIELFPDEEERLLEVYSPPASALTGDPSSPSPLEEDSINDDFDEVMSIHFDDLLRLQTIGQEHKDDGWNSRGHHP